MKQTSSKLLDMGRNFSFKIEPLSKILDKTLKTKSFKFFAYWSNFMAHYFYKAIPPQPQFYSIYDFLKASVTFEFE